ncbi:MAG: hypothetical protein Q4P78_07675 [Rothia sp. (in: high G+C Gram-positive bacteria)]|uniref:hypothetical protein n=1 Tax=Rothia sp. (in: high G+C Gram-positive bacteria) TaxID=1885016 RepID=UPI0026DF9527|nr:hypothetical protein [Rothia sp. (in: high G+C Gram-positive bacteria)]MDO5751056.1 hypothetical protein [Rothia sp. (in: high G+C Gram-positive bacteria)]
MENTNISRRKVVAGAAWAAPVVAASAVVPAYAASNCTDFNTTATLGNTTTDGSLVTKTFTVPTGVTSIKFTVVGAAGGGGRGASAGLNYAGGAGAQVTGTLAVTPGQTLTLTAAGGGIQNYNKFNSNSGPNFAGDTWFHNTGGKGWNGANGGDTANLWDDHISDADSLTNGEMNKRKGNIFAHQNVTEQYPLPQAGGNPTNLLYARATPRYGGSGGGASALLLDGDLVAVAGGGGGAGIGWSANYPQATAPTGSVFANSSAPGGYAGTSPNAPSVTWNTQTGSFVTTVTPGGNGATSSGGTITPGTAASAGTSTVNASGYVNKTNANGTFYSRNAASVAGGTYAGASSDWGMTAVYQGEAPGSGNYQAAAMISPGAGGGGYGGGASGVSVASSYQATSPDSAGKYNVIGAIHGSGGGAGGSFVSTKLASDGAIATANNANTVGGSRVNGNIVLSYCTDNGGTVSL